MPERNERLADRIELAATILMAAAAIFTAWAAFQATKWSGEEAQNFNLAAAARTDSVKFTTVESRRISIDVSVFLQWYAAYQVDLRSGAVSTEGAYVPDPTTSSGFVALRFRDEFKPAFDAWMASAPVVNAESTGTPFDLPEYQLSASADAVAAETRADELVAEAQKANERGDNYVMLTVLFATGLFFAAMSGKLDGVRNSAIALVMGVVIVVTSVAVMAVFPVQL